MIVSIDAIAKKLSVDGKIAGEELFNGIIYSVHQLQHAMRLAGVDKEINL